MADSTLDPDYILGGKDRSLGSGHGTRGLGPSDNSDSGSDVANDHDLALDSDTDAQGTGERIDVGSQTLEAGDIGFDHVEAMPSSDRLVDGDFRDPVPLDDDGSVPEDHIGIEPDDSRGDSDTEVKGDIEGGEELGRRTGGVPTARP
ncbi:hypothetical protein [Duganella sp. Leaf61]|uniref:hypothetical protein n=1 Tax=Duganella sp. Leaf61 TaxID=1736227 RepID=UPI000A427513|nr:hypothetical protein [Duganella sp. Leaf61]